MVRGFNELRDALEEAWDQGNACGLDGYVGPGRGTEPIDDEAIYARDRDVDRIMHRCHKAADLSVNPHARIVDAIWTELERQRDTERFGPCVGRAHDLIDGHVDMDAAATAVIDVLPLSIGTSK